jgi:fructan beta-fructosidase
VIDLNEANFRDPKVFWHEPTKRWVMVVSLAEDKRLQFYGSPDLKTWKHLSDFGPAGVPDKPNWECPDMFELAIEGEPDQTRWVLEVDMGSGAVAGGSGGEYFIGTFDGEKFQCDHEINKSHWVDYGRDFYAPVSWSDVPPSDGRRIWIGWMNNWETSRLPTHPWRGAMSIPRSLALRRTPDGLRMVQTPVKELQNLRREPVRLESFRAEAGQNPLADAGISGDRLEILAEFEVGDATEFGFHVRTGNGQQTIVGYNRAKQEVFVDRTKSGQSDFHEAFAGRHAGPLHPREGHILLHIFVDTSSIEVFGNHGETVITDRIFPEPASQGVTLYSEGGSAQVISLQAWHLTSAW